jgi:hypothetical protein
MPIETVRFQVIGPNAQTKTVQVDIENGTGSAQLNIQGINPGVDTIQAFLDSKSLASNQVQTVWQGANGPISVANVQGYVGNGDGSGLFPAGLSSANLSGPQSFSSLMFNTYPQSLFPGDPHSTGNTPDSQPGIQAPLINNGTNTSGAYASETTVQGVSGSFNMALTGSFVVAQAGNITFQAYINSAFVMAINGASFVAGPQYFNGMTSTPLNHYPLLAGFNGGPWPGGEYAEESITINFPVAGVYQFEICVTLGTFGEREFCLLANNTIIPLNSLIATPANIPAGGGNLQLSPPSSGPDIVGATQGYNLLIVGVSFTSTPYIPLWEGTAGQVYISDSASPGQFNFPTLPNGSVVDYNAALALFSLAQSSNSSYQNRLSIQSTGSGYKLVYNGATPDPNIPSTQVVVAYDEFAWFNPTTKSFDTYTPSVQGGGSSASAQVNWLIKPTVSSVNPSSLPGDGGAYSMTVALANPLPPVQATVNAIFSGAGAITVVDSTPIINASGFLVGWTVNVTTSIGSSGASAVLNLLLSDTITFLSGDNFVTQAVTYYNQAVGVNGVIQID